MLQKVFGQPQDLAGPSTVAIEGDQVVVDVFEAVVTREPRVAGEYISLSGGFHHEGHAKRSVPSIGASFLQNAV